MHHLRVALSLFTRTRLRNWPGLVYYYAGWLLYRVSGVRLFSERRLHIDNLIVTADVEGQSGLMFLYEILVLGVYNVSSVSGGDPLRVIFDVGANCGFYTLVVSRTHPAARVFCFEPHPVTFKRLQQNVRCNELQGRVTPVQAAVGAASGDCKLEISAVSSMGVVTASGAADQGGAVTVPMISLDDYAQTEGQYPDSIKIDVEGFEVEVLKGARLCLQHARYVVLEVHSETLASASLDLLHQVDFQTTRNGALIFATKDKSPAAQSNERH